MSQDRTSFHLWLPDIFEFKGGIQVYSAFLLEALQAIAPQSSYRVFLKHDTDYQRGFPFLSSTQYHFAGKFPLYLRTAVFAAQLLGYGVAQPPDLVIASHINFTPAAHWLKRLRGVPYWAVAHGLEAWNINSLSLKSALAKANLILAVSNYTRDRLIREQNLDPALVTLLPNTFDANTFAIAPKPQYLLERYGLTASQPIILTVARLDHSDRYKGYDQILQAMPEIRRHLPNVHYLIVGQGSDLSRIENLIQSLNLSSCVTLTGFVSDAELGAHYNLCDVFAMPSKGEGFGIVYLEALACGKATLGGNQDGAIDALCYGELGVLVDPDDVAKIAQSLVQILQGTYPNPILYQPEALREKVIYNFGFTRFQTTLERLITGII